MDDVKCAGDETSLYDCRFTNEHDCSESEAAGVKCTGESNKRKRKIHSQYFFQRDRQKKD